MDSVIKCTAQNRRPMPSQAAHESTRRGDRCTGGQEHGAMTWSVYGNQDACVQRPSCARANIGPMHAQHISMPLVGNCGKLAECTPPASHAKPIFAELKAPRMQVVLVSDNQGTVTHKPSSVRHSSMCGHTPNPAPLLGLACLHDGACQPK